MGGPGVRVRRAGWPPGTSESSTAQPSCAVVAVVHVAVAEEHRGGVGGDERVGPEPAEDLDEAAPQRRVVRRSRRRGSRGAPRRRAPSTAAARATSSARCVGQRVGVGRVGRSCPSRPGWRSRGAPRCPRAVQRASVPPQRHLRVVGVGEHGQGPGRGWCPRSRRRPDRGDARSMSASSTSAWVTSRIVSWRCPARPARHGRPGGASTRAGSSTVDAHDVGVDERRRRPSRASARRRRRPADGPGRGPRPADRPARGRPARPPRGCPPGASRRRAACARSALGPRDRPGRPAASRPGRPGPWTGSTMTVVAAAARVGRRVVPVATAAFQSRAPSRCTGSPAAATAASRSSGHTRRPPRRGCPRRTPPRAPPSRRARRPPGGRPRRGRWCRRRRRASTSWAPALSPAAAGLSHDHVLAPPASTTVPGGASSRRAIWLAIVPRRHEQGGLLAHPLGEGSASRRRDGRVVAEAVVAHLGVGHGPAHRRGGPGDGVAAQVDAAVGVGHAPEPSRRPMTRRPAGRPSCARWRRPSPAPPDALLRGRGRDAAAEVAHQDPRAPTWSPRWTGPRRR